MKVALWAEIRRLAEIEKLSRRAISRRLHCSRYFVRVALKLDQPPTHGFRMAAASWTRTRPRLAYSWPKILTSPGERIREEIALGPDGYQGSAIVVRRYLRTVRPAAGRRQSAKRSTTNRPRRCKSIRASAAACESVAPCAKFLSLLAVLCYSRLIYIEFTLSQRKAEFYRGVVNALNFFGASPRAIIVDNLKAAVINGSGRTPVSIPSSWHCAVATACSRSPVSDAIPSPRGSSRVGCVMSSTTPCPVGADELVGFEDYAGFAAGSRNEVADVEIHETTRQRPVDRFQQEPPLLRALPAIAFDTDEVARQSSAPMRGSNSMATAVPRLRSSHSRSTIRAKQRELRVLHNGEVVAQHVRSYQRGELIVLPEHTFAALVLRRRSRSSALEQEFDALGQRPGCSTSASRASQSSPGFICAAC